MNALRSRWQHAHLAGKEGGARFLSSTDSRNSFCEHACRIIASDFGFFKRLNKKKKNLIMLFSARSSLEVEKQGHSFEGGKGLSSLAAS